MKFTVTPNAAKAINKHMAQKEAGKNAGLRVGVRGGGCSGLSYVLQAENLKAPTDSLIEEHGAKVYIDAKSALFLEGCELDYLGGLMESGFKITKPGEKRKSCGCGESFSP